MAAIVVAQNSFVSGEVSPKISARTDVEQRFMGCERLRNVTVLAHGPATRRGGTRHIAAVKDESRVAKLFDFTFNKRQSYIIVFNAGVIRFYTKDGEIQSGAAAYEIAHPYTDEQLVELRQTQMNDIMILCHPTVKPKQLKRLGHTNWVLEDITFMSQPSEWVTDNYPTVCAFFEQRLYFAATPNQPQKIWASVTADFFNMNPQAGTEVAEKDAIYYNISSEKANGIVWLLPKDKMLIGTIGSEFVFTSSDLGDPLSPKNARAIRETTYGSFDTDPLLLDQSVFFVQRGGTKLRAFSYSFASDSYQAADTSILSSHLLEPGLTKIVYQSMPESIIWCLTKTGELLGFTYEEQQKVAAWHPHSFQNGVVQDIAVLEDEAFDTLWMIVDRQINGQPRRYIESMRHAYYEHVDQKHHCFLDSYASYEGEATSVISGLDHLEGEEVLALVDGWQNSRQVVSGGQITLDSPGSIVYAGIPMTSLIRPLRLASAEENIYFHEKSITTVNLSVHNTLGIQVGPVGGPYETVIAQQPRVMGVGPALYSGDLNIGISAESRSDLRFEIIQDTVFPLTLLAWATLVQVGKLA